MSDLILQLHTRTHSGNDIRKLKNTGIIPVVAYNSTTNLVAQINKNEFISIYRKLKEANDFTLLITLDGKTMNVLIKDMDINPVTNEPRHVDFFITK